MAGGARAPREKNARREKYSGKPLARGAAGMGWELCCPCQQCGACCGSRASAAHCRSQGLVQKAASGLKCGILDINLQDHYRLLDPVPSCSGPYSHPRFFSDFKHTFTSSGSYLVLWENYFALGV